MTREQQLQELESIEAETARRRLSAFVPHAWKVLEPNRPLEWNWHLDILCEELEAIARGKVKEELINIPPGTMKTLMCAVIWPAWVWTWEPSAIFLSASYVADRSTDSARKMRDVVMSTWYKNHYKIAMRADQDVKTWFINTKGGAYFATSTGSKATGWHPDYKIVDDPHSPEETVSEIERNAAITWFDQTLSTRGAGRNAATLVIMQRLHEEDLSGHIIAKGGYRHLCWPMRYETFKKPEDKFLRPGLGMRDPRTKEGELLWPALFPEARVAKLERDLNPYGAAGQLQQRPAPAGGGLFKGEWFPIVDEAPPMYRKMRAWDVAGTEDGGCNTAGVLIGDAGEGTKPRFYVMDCEAGQWSSREVDYRMRRTAEADGVGTAIREEQEPGSAGKSVIEQRRLKMIGFDYDSVAPSGDKVTRANPFRSQAEGKNVALVRGSWNSAYITELESFPNGKLKDRVDASAHAFNCLMTGPGPARVRRVSWR